MVRLIHIVGAMAFWAVFAEAQDSEDRTFASPEPSSGPGVAMPVAAPTGQDEFATDSPGGGSVAPPPPAMLTPPLDFAPPASASSIKLPTGPMVSDQTMNSRLIEVQRPERVQVYPDDPDSAWWEINPHFAFDRAQREQRPLMLLFTADWNTQALALSQEVFATKSFNEYVKENLVICYLNYPKNSTDSPDTLRRIKEKFKVHGYPNVLIFNPNGEVGRGIRGYRTGRPVDYFNELVAACHPVLESIEVQKAELVRKGYRDWSNYLGKLVFARFVEHDPSHVILQDAAGQKWNVPINDLAPDDQRMVESFPGVIKVGSN